MISTFPMVKGCFDRPSTAFSYQRQTNIQYSLIAAAVCQMHPSLFYLKKKKIASSMRRMLTLVFNCAWYCTYAHMRKLIHLCKYPTGINAGIGVVCLTTLIVVWKFVCDDSWCIHEECGASGGVWPDCFDDDDAVAPPSNLALLIRPTDPWIE